MVGVMTTPQVNITLPAGVYVLSICFGGYLPIGKKGKHIDLTLSTTETIRVNETGYTCLEFRNKERWWDIVFTIDLVVWLVLIFFTLPYPWNIVYHVLSDGFFLAWIIRLVAVRKRYFAFATTYRDTPPEEQNKKK